MSANVLAIEKSSQSPWKVWETIKLGTGIKDGEGFVNTINKRYLYGIGDIITEAVLLAKDEKGISCFPVAKEPTEINLVNVSVTELGVRDMAFLEKEVYEAAQNQGLVLCPPEVGPQFCLQDRKQKRKEKLYVGMNPIKGLYDSLSLFYLVKYLLGRALRAERGIGGGNCWRAYDRFIFALPGPWQTVCGMLSGISHS